MTEDVDKVQAQFSLVKSNQMRLLQIPGVDPGEVDGFFRQLGPIPYILFLIIVVGALAFYYERKRLLAERNKAEQEVKEQYEERLRQRDEELRRIADQLNRMR